MLRFLDHLNCLPANDRQGGCLPLGVHPVGLLALCGLFALIGCQNPNNRAAFPWSGSPPAAAPADPSTAATAPGQTAQPRLLGRLRRNTYLSDLQSRADEQTRLAAEQQRRLEQLRELQQLNDQQLADLRAQQERAREAALTRKSTQDQQLAQRARSALGRYDELQRRAQGLDRDNSDLQSRVAQVQQRNALLEDQNHLLRKRLEETSQQLASAIESTRESQERLQTMMASSRRRGGATITANNSFKRNLTAVMIPGLMVRQDGEVVRIELPTDGLFESGTARLRPDAVEMLDQVAEVILKHYPRQIVGVEAHADNTPVSGTMWRSSHQLTAAQAMSVFEHLSYRHQLLPRQMFVLGHGENYPLASNATAAGQARNRRVEVVIYPEQVGQR